MELRRTDYIWGIHSQPMKKMFINDIQVNQDKYWHSASKEKIKAQQIEVYYLFWGRDSSK